MTRLGLFSKHITMATDLVGPRKLAINTTGSQAVKHRWLNMIADDLKMSHKFDGVYLYIGRPEAKSRSPAASGQGETYQ